MSLCCSDGLSAIALNTFTVFSQTKQLSGATPVRCALGARRWPAGARCAATEALLRHYMRVGCPHSASGGQSVPEWRARRQSCCGHTSEGFYFVQSPPSHLPALVHPPLSGATSSIRKGGATTSCPSAFQMGVGAPPPCSSASTQPQRPARTNWQRCGRAAMQCSKQASKQGHAPTLAKRRILAPVFLASPSFTSTCLALTRQESSITFHLELTGRSLLCRLFLVHDAPRLVDADKEGGSGTQNAW